MKIRERFRNVYVQPVTSMSNNGRLQGVFIHNLHNVVDRGVLQAMWEELAGKVGHRDQLIIC